MRAELKRRGLDGFIVPRADRHQNEYVPPSEERLAWLTGFTGSAGAAIVLADRAVIFVDGRYLLQVRDQIDTALFAVEHLVENPPDKWLETNLPAGARFGYDPWLHTAEGAEKLAKACTAAGATLVPAEPNPIDSVWTDRPAPPLGRVVVHDLKFAGEAAAEKLARVQAEIGKLKADALVVSDPHNVAWTFNIRGADVSHTPLPLAFASVPREGRASLYIDGRKLSNEVRDYLETLADVREPGAFADDLKALGAAKATVRLDSATAADALARLIADAGGTVARGADPITLMKAVKNATEIAGTRAAHARDGAAVANFLCWFDREAPQRQAHRDRRGRGAGNLPPRHRRCSRNCRSRPSRAPARTARSCITASPARPTARSRRANCSCSIPARSTRTARPTSPAPSRSARRPPRCATASPACSRATSRSRARCFPTAPPARSSIPSRASSSGPPASTSITAPATASAAISRCTRARRASPSSAPRRSSAA